eukprot:scaffold29289_cov129-Isochrysis_galbana.AAC.1
MHSFRASVRNTATLVSYGIFPPWAALAASTSIACEVVRTVSAHAGTSWLEIPCMKPAGRRRIQCEDSRRPRSPSGASHFNVARGPPQRWGAEL